MRIIIFGTGKYLANRYEHFDGEDIVCFADNSEVMQCSKFLGYDVINPNRILDYEFDYICVMVSQKYATEIRMQLNSLGVSADKVIDFEQYMLQQDPDEKSFLIWGTGQFYSNRRGSFAEKNIIAYVDNDKNKQGKIYENRIVLSPDKISENEYDYIILMVGTKNINDIKKTLESLNVDKKKIIVHEEYLKLFPSEDTVEFNETEYFFEHFKQPGLKLTKNCLKKTTFKPLVSIVTPFYNAGKYFKETFNSVVNQTFPWFEWIIVDDGTTDVESLEVVSGVEKLDARIRLIRQENMGLSGARNTGFDAAKTEIVIPLDADDVIEPQYIEYIYWGLFFNSDAAWAYTWTYGFGNQEYLWKKNFDIQAMLKDNLLVATAGIRKKIWKEVGGYEIRKDNFNEDWKFWLDCLRKDFVPVQLGGYKFGYRRLDNGMLAGIKKDEKLQQENSKIIKDAADGINNKLSAVEYPCRKVDIYKKHQEVKWDYLQYSLKSEKKHILWIIPWMIMGGADKFNYDAMFGLKRAGFEISIITTLASDNNWQYKFAEVTDDIYNLPDFLEPQNYLDYVEYYIKSRNIDSVMVSNSTLGYYMIPFLRMKFPKLPIVDYVHMEEWYWRGGGHARTSAVMSSFTDKTYVCNSATREAMIDYFDLPEDKIETMYIGVDETAFDPEKTESGWLYEKMGIEKTRPIVLFPCRLADQKRPLFMVEIAKKVVAKNSEVVFAVVGDGPLGKQMKQLVRQYHLHKNIKFIGRCDDMKLCYKDAKLTLVCSIKEGLSLTAYESCAMETPVISADVGGQRDLIGSDVGSLIKYRQVEKNAIRTTEIDQQELEEYVDAILLLLSNEKEYQKCVSNCRKKILKGFTISNMRQNIVKVFSQIEHQANDLNIGYDEKWIRDHYLLAVEREY